MIEKIEVYGCSCDNCGEHYSTDEYDLVDSDREAIEETVNADQSWFKTDDGKHYCPDCWSVDNSGNLVIRPKED